MPFLSELKEGLAIAKRHPWRIFSSLLIGTAFAAPILDDVIFPTDNRAEYRQTTGDFKTTKPMKVNGDFRLTGGKFDAQHPLDVKGEFYLGKDVEFVHNNVPITLRGNIHVEKKSRTITTPAQYASETVYDESGAIPYETGALITATGSYVEFFTPSLGSVIIAP